jgi:hypothetical protein
LNFVTHKMSDNGFWGTPFASFNYGCARCTRAYRPLEMVGLMGSSNVRAQREECLNPVRHLDGSCGPQGHDIRTNTAALVVHPSRGRRTVTGFCGPQGRDIRTYTAALVVHPSRGRQIALFLML